MSFTTRFAPSPTGPLHLGHAYSAILAHDMARAATGRFLLRIEDIDTTRARPEWEARIFDDLRWLGLDWDEGPDVGGPHGPYRQSERAEIHAEHLDRLEVYPCTCSRREISEASVAPHGQEPVYPGTCRDGPSHPGRPAALRWRVPDRRMEVVDALGETLVQDLRSEVGDFVVRRNDGAFSYQLAVVVDDALMGISEVCRGRDLWLSTPRQVALQRALGFSTPRYAHVPLVRGPDGEKLNKRHGAPDLGELRAAGVDPRRVIAALAHSAGLVGAEVTHVSPRELVEDFDLSAVGRADGHVDVDIG